MLQPTIESLQIEEKLAKLREEWKKATISRRDIIKRQARALQIAKEKILRRINPQQKINL